MTVETPATPPAHRLALTAAEWALLVRQTGFRPPPGFAPGDPAPTPDQLRAAASGLAVRRVVTLDDGADPLDCEPVRPVAANLGAFTAARAVIQVDVRLADRWSRAAYAIAGPVAASLFALADGGVEVSMFAAVALGAELVRAVPSATELAAATPAAALLGSALGDGGHPPGGGDHPLGAGSPVLTGRLPLAALAEYAPAAKLAGAIGQQRVTAALRLTAAQAWLAEQLDARTNGMLRAVVTGRVGTGTDVGLGVGQVVWLATDDGWLGVRPTPDGSGRQMVEIRPVARDEFGTWLAPYLARLMEDSGE